jgi:glycosyltransferase involved in cell wall biosynthesis
MRILVTYVTVGRGGDAVQLAALGRALRTQGHHVRVVGATGVRPYAFDSLGARLRDAVRRLPWWGRDAAELGLSLAAAVRALQRSRGRPWDLLIHRASLYDGVMGIVALRRRIPMVLYLDAHVESERAFRGEGYWRRPHAWAMRFLGRVASVIVTPSRAVADYYATLGVPREKILVRRNGVSEDHLRIGQDSLASHPPMRDPTSCTVGFVGSLSKWHGVDVLVDAAHHLVRGNGAYHHNRTNGAAAHGHRRYKITIIGRGREDETLRARASALGIDGYIEWRGALSHDDAVQAMREFDIAVLPNTLHTGAPMKLAEYAAMGRPMIGPDRPNIREMFAGEQEIVLVPPGDAPALASAIERLAGRPDEARRLGLAARHRIARHTWEHTVDLLVQHALEPSAPAAGHTPLYAPWAAERRPSP